MASPADLRGCVAPYILPYNNVVYYLKRDGAAADSTWTVLYTNKDDLFGLGGEPSIAVEEPYIRMAQNYLSTDDGTTFAYSTMYDDSSVPGSPTMPVYPQPVSDDGVIRWYGWTPNPSTDYILYSDNRGRPWKLLADLPLPAGSLASQTILSCKILQNGQIHVLLRANSLSPVGQILYYFHSDDLGATWAGPIDIGTVAGPTWTGGIADTTPSGYYYDAELYVYGNNVAIGMIERERRLSYTSVYQDLYVDYPVPPIQSRTYIDQLQTYYPMDFLIKVSTDGGNTFGDWTRIKNDADQTLNAGETKAWGSTNSVMFSGGLSTGPSLPIGAGLIFGSSGGDLYMMSTMWEITKTMGGDTRTVDPDDFDGTGFWHDPLYDPTWERVMVSYRIPGWTGTPVRTVLSTNIPDGVPRSVTDEDDDTFIVFGNIGNTVYETFFNGAFGLNAVLVVDDVGQTYNHMGACWPVSGGAVNVYLF